MRTQEHAGAASQSPARVCLAATSCSAPAPVRNSNAQLLSLYAHRHKARLAFPTAPVPRLLKHRLKLPANLSGAEHKLQRDQEGKEKPSTGRHGVPSAQPLPTRDPTKPATAPAERGKAHCRAQIRNRTTGTGRAEGSASNTAGLQILTDSKERKALFIESFKGSAGINFLLICRVALPAMSNMKKTDPFSLPLQCETQRAFSLITGFVNLIARQLNDPRGPVLCKSYLSRQPLRPERC